MWDSGHYNRFKLKMWISINLSLTNRVNLLGSELKVDQI